MKMVQSMHNATAASDANTYMNFARESKFYNGTASRYLSYPRPIESNSEHLTETNPTRSNPNVGLEGFGPSVVVLNFTASNTSFTDFARASQVPMPGWKEKAKAAIEELAGFPDGWDGPDSLATSKEAMQVAKAMIEAWPNDLIEPELDILFDGSLVFEVFDDRGFALASIETKADGSIAYVVASGTKILASTRETDLSSLGIARVFKNILNSVS